MWKAALVIWLVALAPGVSSAAEAEKPTTLTASAAIEPALKPVRDHVTNMKAKIDRGVSSMALSDPDAAPIVGWAAKCCARNLKALEKSIPNLEASAVRLAEVFRGAGRGDGEGLAMELARDCQVLAQILQRFSAAPNEAEARTILAHVTRATANLVIDQRNIARCCDDVPIP